MGLADAEASLAIKTAVLACILPVRTGQQQLNIFGKAAKLIHTCKYGRALKALIDLKDRAGGVRYLVAVGGGLPGGQHGLAARLRCGGARAQRKPYVLARVHREGVDVPRYAGFRLRHMPRHAGLCCVAPRAQLWAWRQRLARGVLVGQGGL